MNRAFLLVLTLAAACERPADDPRKTPPASSPAAAVNPMTVNPMTVAWMEARGGAHTFLGISTIHVEGVVKFPGGASAELDAYLDQRSGIPRAMILFKSNGAARILCFDGKLGYERDEAGLYKPAVESALDDLKRVTMALLVAAQFPYGDHWKASGPAKAEWRDAARDFLTVVELDTKNLPAAAAFGPLTPRAAPPASIPAGPAGGPQSSPADAPQSSPADSPRCAYADWKAWEGLHFPATLRYSEPGQSWTLEVSRWDPHAFVTDAIYSPPPVALESRPAAESRPHR